MGKMKEVFMDLQEKMIADELDEYFIWLTEQQYEEEIERKYGHKTVTSILIKESGETSLKKKV